MPMMSTPSSVTSPAMQAILVVPMSSPTMISLVFALAILILECNGHVVAGVEVDRANADALGFGELGPHGVEHLEVHGGDAVAELEGGVAGVRAQRDAAVVTDMDLADRRPSRIVCAPACEHGERGDYLGGGAGGVAQIVRARDPGDDREVGNLAVVGEVCALERVAARIDEVELAERDDGDRLVLADVDDDRARQHAANV